MSFFVFLGNMGFASFPPIVPHSNLLMSLGNYERKIIVFLTLQHILEVDFQGAISNIPYTRRN